MRARLRAAARTRASLPSCGASAPAVMTLTDLQPRVITSSCAMLSSAQSARTAMCCDGLLRPARIDTVSACAAVADDLAGRSRRPRPRAAAPRSEARSPPIASMPPIGSAGRSDLGDADRRTPSACRRASRTGRSRTASSAAAPSDAPASARRRRRRSPSRRGATVRTSNSSRSCCDARPSPRASGRSAGRTRRRPAGSRAARRPASSGWPSR